MKIPFLNIWVTRTDWKTKYSLLKAKPRDEKGRFISKKKLMTEQLRQEVSSPTDWDALKKAIKKRSLGNEIS